MKALRYIGILLLTLIGLFLILGIVAPKKSHIERSISINAAPSAVQSIVSKFSEFKQWNPFLAKDPNAVVNLEGQDGTIGSKYSWSGNKDVGSGNQRVTKIEPGYVENALHFDGAMGGDAISAMKMTEENGGTTKATWSFDMESPYPWNAMNFFMNMDKFLGPEYEKGLASLKTYVESVANKKYKGYEVKELDSNESSYVGIRKTVVIKDIPKFFGEAMINISYALKKAGKEMDGAPAGLYFSYDEKAGTADLAAATMVKGGGAVPDLVSFNIPAGKEVCVDYYGAYDKVGAAHYAIDEYLKEKGIKAGTPVIESYINDPMAEKDTAKWLTRVIYPLVK